MGALKDVVTKIERFIPGLSGYKGKELLREEDLALRRKVREMLEEALTDLRTAEQQAILSSNIDPTAFEEMVVQKLQTVINQISAAEAGYGGLFDQITVEEGTLAKILENDAKILEKAEELRSMAKEAASAVMAGKPLDFQGFAALVKEIESLVERRRELLRGGGAE